MIEFLKSLFIKKQKVQKESLIYDIEIYVDAEGRYRFRIYSFDDIIMVSSDSYSNEIHAKSVATDFLHHAKNYKITIYSTILDS